MYCTHVSIVKQASLEDLANSTRAYVQIRQRVGYNVTLLIGNTIHWPFAHRENSTFRSKICYARCEEAVLQFLSRVFSFIIFYQASPRRPTMREIWQSD